MHLGIVWGGSGITRFDLLTPKGNSVQE